MFGLDLLGFHADTSVKVNTPLRRRNYAGQELGSTCTQVHTLVSIFETQTHCTAAYLTPWRPGPRPFLSAAVHLPPLTPPTLIFIGFAATDTLTASPGTAASKCVHYGGITPAAS